MKKQKENSLENITWSELGKQNVQAKVVYWGLIQPDMLCNSARISSTNMATMTSRENHLLYVFEQQIIRQKLEVILALFWAPKKKTD